MTALFVFSDFIIRSITRIFCWCETMQAIDGIVFTTTNQTVFKSTLRSTVADILVISASAVKVISVTSKARRQLSENMERLPSLEAIGVDAIYIITATRTNTTAISKAIISKKAALSKALVTAGFSTASPQTPFVSTNQKFSPSAAPSELQTNSALIETNSHYALIACTLALALIQTFIYWRNTVLGAPRSSYDLHVHVYYTVFSPLGCTWF